MASDRLMSTRQVREQYLPGMSKAALYRAIDSGRLRAVRSSSRKLLIRESDVQRYIAAMEPVQTGRQI